MKTETAVFATGCFWCSEPIFRMLKGVLEVKVGYAGGTTESPTYERVLTGETGHAEVSEVTFDADKVSFEELLNIYFYIHDPTQLNRQGADVGTQYRSAIFYTSDAQKEAAVRTIAELQKEYKDKIVTEVKSLENFWSAEQYHQRYFEKNPEAAYCQVVVAPKLERFTKTFSKLIDSNE